MKNFIFFIISLISSNYVLAAHDSIVSCSTSTPGSSLFSRTTAATGAIYNTIAACVQSGVASVSSNSCMTHSNFAPANIGSEGFFTGATYSHKTDASCAGYSSSYNAYYTFTRAACEVPEVRNVTGYCACPLGQYHDTPTTCIVDPCAGEPPIDVIYPITAECLSSVAGSPTCAPPSSNQACGSMPKISPGDCTQSADLLSCSATYGPPSASEQDPPGTSVPPSPTPPNGGVPAPAPDPCIAAGTCTPVPDPCIAAGTCSGSGGGSGSGVPGTGTIGTTTGEQGIIDAINAAELARKAHDQSIHDALYDRDASGMVIPEERREIFFAPVIFSSSATCPSPIPFSMMGVSYFISYDPMCEIMSLMRPLILAMAAFSATLIFIGGLKT